MARPTRVRMAPLRTCTATIVTIPSTIMRTLEYKESRLRPTDGLANSWCSHSPVLGGVKALGYCVGALLCARGADRQDWREAIRHQVPLLSRAPAEEELACARRDIDP